MSEAAVTFPTRGQTHGSLRLLQIKNYSETNLSGVSFLIRSPEHPWHHHSYGRARAAWELTTLIKRMWNFVQDVIRPLKRNQTTLITQWSVWNSSVEYFRNPEGVLRQSKHAVKWYCCSLTMKTAWSKAATQLNRTCSMVAVLLKMHKEATAEVKTWQETDLHYVSSPSYLWASQSGNLYKSGCSSCSHYTFVKALECKLKVCPLSTYLLLNPLWSDLLWHEYLSK